MSRDGPDRSATASGGEAPVRAERSLGPGLLAAIMDRRDLLGGHTNGLGGDIPAGTVVPIVAGVGVLDHVTAFTG